MFLIMLWTKEQNEQTAPGLKVVRTICQDHPELRWLKNENDEIQERQHKAPQAPQLHKKNPYLTNNGTQKDTRLYLDK